MEMRHREETTCPQSHSWYVMARSFQPSDSVSRGHLFNPRDILTPSSDTSEGCFWGLRKIMVNIFLYSMCFSFYKGLRQDVPTWWHWCDQGTKTNSRPTDIYETPGPHETMKSTSGCAKGWGREGRLSICTWPWFLGAHRWSMSSGGWA